MLQQTGDEFRREAYGWCQGMGTSFQGPAAAAAGCVCLFQTFGQSSVCLCQRMPVYPPTRRHGIVRRRGGTFFFPSRLGAAGIVRASARNQQMSAAPRPCAASWGFILRYVLTERGVGVRYEFWGAVKGGDEEVIWRWQG